MTFDTFRWRPRLMVRLYGECLQSEPGVAARGPDHDRGRGMQQGPHLGVKGAQGRGRRLEAGHR